MAITKPPVKPTWAETAVGSPDIVEPSGPEISAGWPQSVTPPARGRWNWILNYCANAVRYFSRRGIVDYDAAETYLVGDIVRGDDGLLYRSQVNANLNNTPSASAAQWGVPLVPLAAADDTTSKVASTAYVIGQLATTNPAMDGTAAVGTSKKTARADHVHPRDTTKADTTGSYGGMTVGASAFAATAPWSGISGKPTTVNGYGITDAITTANIGVQSVAFATVAGRARPLRGDGVAFDLNWSGLGGQPNWLVGSNDGVSFNVYNPANFSVNFATSANFSTTQPIGTSNTSIATTAFANPAASITTSGFVKLPSGLIIQWGMIIISGSGANYLYGVQGFPIAFPNAPLSVVATGTTRSDGESLSLPGFIDIVSANPLSASAFEWRIDTNEGIPLVGTHVLRYFAVGY